MDYCTSVGRTCRVGSLDASKFLSDELCKGVGRPGLDWGSIRQKPALEN